MKATAAIGRRRVLVFRGSAVGDIADLVMSQSPRGAWPRETWPIGSRPKRRATKKSDARPAVAMRSALKGASGTRGGAPQGATAGEATCASLARSKTWSRIELSALSEVGQFEAVRPETTTE